MGNFDPNNPSTIGSVWAIYYDGEVYFSDVRQRRSYLVTLVDRGTRPCRLYECVPGQGWVLRAYRRDPDIEQQDKCQNCGQQVSVTWDYKQAGWQRHAWHLRRQGGKLPKDLEMVFHCQHCWREVIG